MTALISRAETPTMRLFVGLEPTPAFRAALSVMQDRLRAVGVDARYSEPANLHLTLAFIGQWPTDVTALLPALEAPFSIALSHPGIFPKARVIWAGVQPSPALYSLAARVRRALDAAGVPYDPQPFNPHITLGRKPIVPEGVTLSQIAVPPASMTVRQICLYRSERRETGMAYTVIGRTSY